MDEYSKYSKRLHACIPGGSHTYSRGSDQFPYNAPSILESGSGCRVYDLQGSSFLDYGMALRAVTLGYSHPEINEAAINAITKGNNLTLPSKVELEAAERFIDHFDHVDMVKFTKNGSTAVSAAVKLARAATGKDLILRCNDHPFFSFDDWFIGSTVMPKGVPKNIQSLTLTFPYNDIEAIKKIISENSNRVACIVMEAITIEEPKVDPITGQNFLQQVQALCNQSGIVFILDEMITGFRCHIKGAQHKYNIKPDLCTFGKAMANGFSVAVVGGKEQYMQLAGTDQPGQERVFFLSTTHGAEMCGLAAFMKTIDIYVRDSTVDTLQSIGKKLKDIFLRQIHKHEVSDYFKIVGPDYSPSIVTLNHEKNSDLSYKTYFVQCMLEQQVFMPWIALSTAHDHAALEQTEAAIDYSLERYRLAINESSCEQYLQGKVIKPVFRTFN
jgi:glutamate-1-semialdehyde 2,1-aminomutase